MTTENKVVAGINSATELIGSVVPAVAAISSLVKLLGAAIRPKLSPDQQKSFDAAVAELDAAKAQLDTATGPGFEAAKAEALQKETAKAAQPAAGNPVGAMGTGPATKPTNG